MGELGEAEIYLRRCTEYEPDVESHKNDLAIIKELKTAYDEMGKSKFIYDYKKCEGLCDKLLKKNVETIDVKKNYLECLIKNEKISPALTFIRTLSDDEKKDEDIVYLSSLANYYEGK
jgi:hypothetical protein